MYTKEDFPYCIFGYEGITDVGTFSFRWILPFWYHFFRLVYKASRFQRPRGRVNCQTRAGTPRARCMKKIYGNLRKPARRRRARAMRWFCRGQKYSTAVVSLSSTRVYTLHRSSQLFVNMLRSCSYVYSSTLDSRPTCTLEWDPDTIPCDVHGLRHNPCPCCSQHMSQQCRCESAPRPRNELWVPLVSTVAVVQPVQLGIFVSHKQYCQEQVDVHDRNVH